MDPHEIQARAAITAVLIHKSPLNFDIGQLGNGNDAAVEKQVVDLRKAVDRIYESMTKHHVP